jgi:ech hydrogenase subunit E
VGFLTKQQAHDLGCVGPFLRASGIPLDMRQTGYAAYPNIDFEPIISTVGDSYARTDVRIREIFQSMDIIRQAVAKIPDGEVATPVKGFPPQGEYFMRVEQPRGEAMYYVKANGTKFLDRVRVRTPTFANIPGLLETLKGCQVADVPILVLTIDPCISCTER